MNSAPTRPATAQIHEGQFRGEINAAFDTPSLRNWLREIGTHVQSPEARLIYRVRNLLYRLPAPDGMPGAGEWCVKAFARPPRLRSFVYSVSAGGSKARRSFAYAAHLHHHGVGVATPIAYLERWDGRRQLESYFITTYVPEVTSFTAEMIRLLREDPDCGRFLDLLRLVARAVRAMHDAGFVHQDLGGQNILLHRADSGEWASPVFIDLNRGRILPEASLQDRARDMAKLEIPSNLRRAFFHMYFGDDVIPAEFARRERWCRARINFHNQSRKFRHPIRHLIHSKRFIVDAVASSALPSYGDMWLWDRKSGQPAVMLERRDRNKYYARSDLWFLGWHNLIRLPSIWRRYRRLLAQAYQHPITMARRIGVTVDLAEGMLEDNLAPLDALPAIPVLVRCYFHQGESGLERSRELVSRLAAAGHEITLGLVQSRQAVLSPDAWGDFCERVLAAMHPHARFVEIGHAVNRAKWGIWRFSEVEALYARVDALRTRYPEITFLGPAVNDFEFHYYPPLLARMGDRIDGLSCHLYVDRRGAPESRQGPFSLLEKSALGRAIAEDFGIRQGFYITEINWPLRGVGEYSPVQSTYRLPAEPEHRLAVDEETYAAYMVRSYLIALCSGFCERIWWWSLTSRGFGLVDDVGGFRRRPAWHALVQLHRALASDSFRQREERDGAVWFHFDRCSIAYALTPVTVSPPAGRGVVEDMLGARQPVTITVSLTGNPVYFLAS